MTSLYCTYQFGWFVLSAIDDRLKPLPHNTLELSVILESLHNDPVDFGLQLQQLLYQGLVPL